MRLIDADDLIEEIKNSPLIDFTDDDIIKLINIVPTVKTPIEYFVDMEKLKSDCLNCEKFKRPQGEWIKTGQSFVNPNKFRNFCCSNCFWELDEHIRIAPNFCQNCGARMRGKENEKM